MVMITRTVMVPMVLLLMMRNDIGDNGNNNDDDDDVHTSCIIIKGFPITFLFHSI